MNINTNKLQQVTAIAFAVFVFAVLSVSYAPLAHATEDDIIFPSSVDSFASYDDTIYPSSVDSFASYDDTIYPSSVDSYAPYTNAYASDYGSGFGGGFSGGGFSYSGMGFGGGSSGGGYSSTYAPTTVSSNTSVYAPTNTNTCTAVNSCNTTTTVDDHSIFNAPTTVTVSGGGSGGGSYPVYVPVYSQQSYPVYNNPCYTCQTPVYPTPTRQPYVSLSQVPYTGLDLGPVGTVVYWGFLALWCAVAAYLVAVKRVQTKVVAGLNSFLFGSKVSVGTHAKLVQPVAHSTHAAKAHAPAVQNEDAIDPFIASQIARNK